MTSIQLRRDVLPSGLHTSDFVIIKIFWAVRLVQMDALQSTIEMAHKDTAK